MKILYIITSILLCVVYIMASIVFYVTDISYSLTGNIQIIYRVFAAIGTLIAPLGILGVILGFRFRKREETQKSLLCTFGGFIMILGLTLCYALFNSFGANLVNESLRAALERDYGEDWDATSNYEQLPETYQVILDKKYVVVRDRWDRDAMIHREHLSWKLPEFYGENSLENIGFGLLDLNGDGNQELLIGQVSEEGEPTVILSVYTDPESPQQVFQTYDTMVHYLHKQDDGTYLVECDVEYDTGEKEVYMLMLTYGLNGNPSSNTAVDIPAEPANRCYVELIPFAEYR